MDRLHIHTYIPLYAHTHIFPESTGCLVTPTHLSVYFLKDRAQPTKSGCEHWYIKKEQIKTELLLKTNKKELFFF